MRYLKIRSDVKLVGGKGNFGRVGERGVVLNSGGVKVQ